MEEQGEIRISSEAKKPTSSGQCQYRKHLLLVLFSLNPCADFALEYLTICPKTLLDISRVTLGKAAEWTPDSVMLVSGKDFDVDAITSCPGIWLAMLGKGTGKGFNQVL